MTNFHKTEHTRVLIIGSGPAGYTAAIYAARAGLSPVLFTGANIGGQLIQTTEIENFPGFSEPILGIDLMDKMRNQSVNVGTRLIFESIIDIDVEVRPFLCIGEKTKYTADAVIIATGASAKWLNVTGEAEFKGNGVSACATCDGFFYKNKTVAVVGGGNTAVIDAIFLTKHASKVIVLHRKNFLRAEKVLQERLFSNPKVEIVWNVVVTKICGDNNRLTGVCISDISTGNESLLHIDGLFVAIGHIPQTSMCRGKLELSADGYIVTYGTTRSSVPGIFAAGDVMESTYQQAVVAAGRGCMAAMDAVHFLSMSGPRPEEKQQ
ncbi:MAG: thioredoxin-disulfide reductase [Holosporales bacterium]|jgi:thioredoxin reductase (NADPH)|nr:thioredoxin-disulfide reductase [Holosporales bacterium]